MAKTKILKIDLHDDLQNVFNQLEIIKGDANNLSDVLLNIDTSMFSENEAEVINDLINGYLNTEKHLSERVNDLERTYGSNFLETGNYNEKFTYEDGNVIKHESFGDQEFTVEYNYKDDGSGELLNSIKTFEDKDANTITITKEYSYEEGDITGIATNTEVTPAED